MVDILVWRMLQVIFGTISVEFYRFMMSLQLSSEEPVQTTQHKCYPQKTFFLLKIELSSCRKFNDIK